MTIEEKAKAYDNLLVKLQEAKVDDNVCDERYCCVIDDIVPELKESKNEKIRKEIISYLHNEKKVKRYISDIEFDKWITWLEKQGEQKSIWHNEDEEPKRGSLILLIMQSGTPIVAKIIEPNHIFNHGERWAYIDDLLEKQGEPKPTDKVEPKFKIGDWISGYYTNYKVLSLNNDGYVVEDVDGDKINILFENEKFHHLFTIADAKDGDILWHSDSASNGIFIFKEIRHDGKVLCYCDYDSEDHFCLGEHHTCCWTDAKILYPATKEQRGLLFQKMKEAGYEWDAEKKELKKIEQNPAWSEEDEEYLRRAINATKDTYPMTAKWLKSLKQRIGG